ncbi:hypothetical protein ACKP2L_08525 [Oenococcus alcoholitolerans]|uniref:Uncharacterized protein n=1 Tax=Oenococcus alcoholitolerans TaxID=931074 RepID=A0ABR4XSV5_9LACO|nr:hypothetical protein Q757_00185 [Oenococcus alcoholitolerans]
MTKSPINKAIDCVCSQYPILTFTRLCRFKEALSPYFAYQKAYRSTEDYESSVRQDELLRVLYGLFLACPVLKAKYCRRKLSQKELCTIFHCSASAINARLRKERAYFADNFKLFDLNRLGKQIEDKHCKDVVLRI